MTTSIFTDRLMAMRTNLNSSETFHLRTSVFGSTATLIPSGGKAMLLQSFKTPCRKKFPSFTPCNKWTNGGQRAVLQNQLFYVALEDNEWSLAVELIQKEAPWPQSYDGLQHKHYQRYLAGIRDTLFEQFESLGIYTGPWTSKTIHRSDVTV